MAATENFGQKLRAWRKSKNWLQKEAAAALDVPLDTYRQWEYNNQSPSKSPSMAEIEKRMEDAK